MSMPPTFSASATCRQRTTQARAKLSRRCSMCRPIPRPVICLRLGCCCGRVFDRLGGEKQKRGGDWVPSFRRGMGYFGKNGKGACGGKGGDSGGAGLFKKKKNK